MLGDSKSPILSDPDTWATSQSQPPATLIAFAHQVGLRKLSTNPMPIQQACIHKSITLPYSKLCLNGTVHNNSPLFFLSPPSTHSCSPLWPYLSTAPLLVMFLGSLVLLYFKVLCRSSSNVLQTALWYIKVVCQMHLKIVSASAPSVKEATPEGPSQDRETAALELFILSPPLCPPPCFSRIPYLGVCFFVELSGGWGRGGKRTYIHGC